MHPRRLQTMLTKLVRSSIRQRTPCTAAASTSYSSTSKSTKSTESHPAGSFLSGSNSIYVEEMYRLWSQDSSSVHNSWDVFFKTGTFQPNASVQPGVSGADVTSQSGKSKYHSNSDAVRAIHLIRAYQDRGHHDADLDPLGLRREAIHIGVGTEEIPDTNPALYGFTADDWDRPLDLDGFTSDAQGGLLNNADLDGDGQTTFGELMTFLQQTYCGTVGYEFTHIRNKEQVNWCADQIEQVVQPCSNKDAKQVLERLDFATSFEATLAKRFNTEKRFGLEGLETLIPGLKTMIDVASENGAEDFVFGMAHRGRLNVLSNVLRKPMELIFKEFLGTPEQEEPAEDSADDWSSSGDVKYHLGTSSSRVYPNGRNVQLSLLANPSHLEAVNPLVMGKARAKMFYKGDMEGKTVVPVLLHGDAAFAGQGVVYESMQMTRLEGYSTGGTIHVVTNNQVGFTADPWQSRSTVYASDLGKTFDAPIFHVNADDAEACVRVFALAARYRQKFGNDVVIDLIGYRKNGHNEIDEPSFTQPIMYETIKKHPTSLSIYRQKLVESGVLTQAEVDETGNFVNGCFDDAFAAAPDYVVPGMEWQDDDAWKDIKNPNLHSPIRHTGVEVDALRKVGQVLATVPEGFNIHRRLNNMILKAKQKTLDSETNIDWGTAEALAFGTLLLEGTGVVVFRFYLCIFLFFVIACSFSFFEC